MATGYVTNYGNSENDGLSWDTPKRSIQSAIDADLSPIYVKGWFNENISTSTDKIYGDGYAVFEGGILDSFLYANYGSLYVSDVVFRNGNYAIYVPGNSPTLYVDNCSFFNFSYFANKRFGSATFGNCLFANIDFNELDIYIKFTEKDVFYNATGLRFSSNSFGSSNQFYHIFSESSLYISSSEFNYIQYSLFHNSTFKFTGGDQDADETEYAAPAGDTDAEKLEDLRTRMATVYGGSSSDYLIGCKYQTDGDLFIDADNENFYLVPGCTAASMSYEASYVGKYPEGAVAEIPADFITYTNIDDDGNITDQTTNAYAETAIQDIGKLRHVNTLKALGERAVRNGNQVNADADLGDAIYPGTDLTDGSTYIVRTEAISLTASGTTRDVGETFIASADDGLAFTSDTGYVQEVYLDKPRCIEIKASKTDATLASATWIKLDLYETPMVNYDENGLISAGNLDDAYDADTAEKMYIRYWKARIYVQAKNLPG